MRGHVRMFVGLRSGSYSSGLFLWRPSRTTHPEWGSWNLLNQTILEEHSFEVFVEFLFSATWITRHSLIPPQNVAVFYCCSTSLTKPAYKRLGQWEPEWSNVILIFATCVQNDCNQEFVPACSSWMPARNSYRNILADCVPKNSLYSDKAAEAWCQ